MTTDESLRTYLYLFFERTFPPTLTPFFFLRGIPCDAPAAAPALLMAPRTSAAPSSPSPPTSPPSPPSPSPSSSSEDELTSSAPMPAVAPPRTRPSSPSGASHSGSSCCISSTSSVFHTASFPLDPPTASRAGESAQNDTQKTLPTPASCEVICLGWAPLTDHSLTVLSIEPVASTPLATWLNERLEVVFACARVCQTGPDSERASK
mmetsp:Transcript_3897/g.8228  ORF Transcript_3897/g.8228 Transcript_3897/m.8228 type:complete len:207 (+) Transcript_3897:313-933(+)